MPPGPNVFKAVIRPRRSRPDGTQDARLELFNWDGEPFEPGGDAPEVEDWIVIADSDMQHGWTHLSGTSPPQYRKRPDGTVEMRGYLDPGVNPNNVTIFNLPVGYRHSTDELFFSVPGSFGSICSFIVAANGDVRVESSGHSAINTMGFVSIAGVRFSVD